MYMIPGQGSGILNLDPWARIWDLGILTASQGSARVSNRWRLEDYLWRKNVILFQEATTPSSKEFTIQLKTTNYSVIELLEWTFWGQKKKSNVGIPLGDDMKFEIRRSDDYQVSEFEAINCVVFDNFKYFKLVYSGIWQRMLILELLGLFYEK